MSTRSQGRATATKIVVMAFLVALCCGLTYYFHVRLRTGLLFTHFFYVPIVLACVWWQRRGLVVAAFLAALLIVSHHLLAPPVLGLNDYVRAAMFVVIGLVAAVLSERSARRERALREATEKTERLNAVLRGIRNVNQLVVREKDPDRLLQDVCGSLTKTRGYRNAWIARFDEAGKVVKTVEAGLGGSFSPMADRLSAGRLTACARRALDESGVVVTEDPPSACGDCPLAAEYAGRGAMTTALRHDGKAYGLICVSMAKKFLAESEEQVFFEEVAGDIAFALYGAEREQARERAAEALRKERDLSQRYLDIVGVMLAVIDVDENISMINKKGCEILGYTEGELLGRDWFDLLVPERAREKVRGVFRKLMAIDVAPVEYHENPLVRKDGEERLISFHNTVLRGARGEIAGVLLSAADITERKRAEEDLREAQEKLLAEQRAARERAEGELAKLSDELVRTTRLAAIGQVSATIAHDLRNPLGSIRNAVFYLRRKATDDQPLLQEYLGIIDQEIDTADGIIHSLLSMAHAKALNKQEVDLGRLTREVLARDQKAEPLRCQISVDPDPFTVHADSDQLRRVVQNLLHNAAAAVGGAGEVFVEASRESDADVIVFRDSGPGVAPEVRETLFDPLVTTKVKGTGLGLTICRQIVERHGGTIDLIDQDAGGAAFRIRLPRLERQAPSWRRSERCPTTAR